MYLLAVFLVSLSAVDVQIPMCTDLLDQTTTDDGQVLQREDIWYEIPSTLIASGVKVHVLAGKSFNQLASYLCSSSWGYSYHIVDIEIYPHSQVALNIPENQESVFLYVYDGTLQELN